MNELPIPAICVVFTTPVVNIAVKRAKPPWPALYVKRPIVWHIEFPVDIPVDTTSNGGGAVIVPLPDIYWTVIWLFKPYANITWVTGVGSIDDISPNADKGLAIATFKLAWLSAVTRVR